MKETIQLLTIPVLSTILGGVWMGLPTAIFTVSIYALVFFFYLAIKYRR
jgi:hypothetical protein